MQFNVRFYTTTMGVKPLLLFLNDLHATEPTLHRLLIAGIKRIGHSEYHGLPLTDQSNSYHDILEVRVGSVTIARAFFFFRPRQEIILTNGYLTDLQRVDTGQLKEALEYKKDWEDRYP